MEREVVLRVPEEIQMAIGARADLSSELLKRIAASLYAERKVSLGKAVELSGLPYDAFMRLLAELGIALDYGVDDFTRDMQTVGRLRQGDRNK